MYNSVMTVSNVAFFTLCSGIVSGIELISGGGATNIITGIFTLMVGIAFAVCALMDGIMLLRVNISSSFLRYRSIFYEYIKINIFWIQVHKIYRSSGASLAKAQQEFTSGVMRNEHVQGAAANIASEAIRSQFRNSSQGGNNGANNPPPPRY